MDGTGFNFGKHWKCPFCGGTYEAAHDRGACAGCAAGRGEGDAHWAARMVRVLAKRIAELELERERDELG